MPNQKRFPVNSGPFLGVFWFLITAEILAGELKWLDRWTSLEHSSRCLKVWEGQIFFMPRSSGKYDETQNK